MVNLDLQNIPIQVISGVINAPVCNKKIWDNIQSKSDEAVKKACGVLTNGTPLAIYEQRLFLSEYIDSLNKIKEETGLVVPYYPTKNKNDDIKYTIYTQIDKLVADYANISIFEVDCISILEYWLLERDAFISALSKTKDGREYLNNAYRITQTEADEELEI